ncbi:hypothetical protein Fmac_019086 [Flemingia macrophylla]|uniref:Pentatricopeptide repeat-containing protein n=1 Tax=Flemingia macrophylla TaxID=520843 RepID=A0ABD1M8S3_9FABA
MALWIYSYMCRKSLLPNNFTFPPLFNSLYHVPHIQCLNTHVPTLGHHCELFVHNSLLHAYASSCHVSLYHRLFDKMPHNDVVSWTILIASYNNIVAYSESLLVFEQMRLEEGFRVFGSMKEKNVFTWNAVIKGFALANKSRHNTIWWFKRMESDGYGGDEFPSYVVAGEYG